MIRHLIPIVFNQVTGLIFGLVGLKLISNLVPPAVYGAYSIYLTLTQLGLLLSLWPCQSRGALLAKEEGQAGSYARYLCKWAGKRLALIPVLVVVTVALSLFNRDVVWLWALPLLLVSNQSLPWPASRMER